MRYILFCLIFCSSLCAKASICLTMMVENDGSRIEECLSSVKQLIDYWVIIDTGSTDQTKEIIQKTLKHIPGRLHECPWVDFSFNRNQLFKLAEGRASYFLFLHPTETLNCSERFSLPALTRDLYYIRDLNGIKRVVLIKSSLDVRWEGSFYPILRCSHAKEVGVLEQVTVGAKESILEKQFWEHPVDPNYAFYRGIFYFLAKQFSVADKFFRHRAQIPSSNLEQTYQTLYYLGQIQDFLGNKKEAMTFLVNAHNFCPLRMEPLVHIAKLYRNLGDVFAAYLTAKFAYSIPFSYANFHADTMTYRFSLLAEYANCALLLGKWEEGLEMCEKILQMQGLDPQIEKQVVANREVAKKNLSSLMRPQQ